MGIFRKDLRIGWREHGGICMIFLVKVVLEEISLVKGYEQAFIVKCIL